MPPARPRAVEDSRSETSSNIGHMKEKNMTGVALGSGVTKSKRTAVGLHHTAQKSTVNGVVAAPPRTGDVDLPKTDWNNTSPSLLRTYRTAYRLPTPSAYTHPHAELIYNSSHTALRAPSAVLARRRLRDLKHQRRKAAVNGVSSIHSEDLNGKGKQKENASHIDADTTSSSDHHLKPPRSNPHHSSQTLDGTSDTSQPSHHPSTSALIPPERIGKQPPTALATAVRKHFNAQQLSEAETVARFAYVVRQTRNREAVRMEGSDGDGGGFWMGSHGREIRRGEGGEVGFRLRFRP